MNDTDNIAPVSVDDYKSSSNDP